MQQLMLQRPPPPPLLPQEEEGMTKRGRKEGEGGLFTLAILEVMTSKMVKMHYKIISFFFSLANYFLRSDEKKCTRLHTHVVVNCTFFNRTEDVEDDVREFFLMSLGCDNTVRFLYLFL